MPSIDRVANAICDWKSIMTRAWFVGVSSLEAGAALAVFMAGSFRREL
jgi:hypothetical protein